MIFTVPNSFGAGPLREENPCHEPGGSPRGGRFAAKGACPLSVQGMARDFYKKTGLQVEPVEKTAKFSGARFKQTSMAGITITAEYLDLVLGTQSDEETLRTIFPHEVGHVLIGHADTRDWKKAEKIIAGSRYSERYADEFLAWAKGIQQYPTNPVKWGVIRAGLASYLIHDPKFHKKAYVKFREQWPLTPSLVGRDSYPEGFDSSHGPKLGKQFRSFKAHLVKTTLDKHLAILKDFQRMQVRKRKAA